MNTEKTSENIFTKANVLLYSVSFSLKSNLIMGNPMFSLLKDFSFFLLTKTHLHASY